MNNRQSNETLPEMLLRLNHECNVSWLYQYYSITLIWSDTAKQTWIDPDVKPLDF